MASKNVVHLAAKALRPKKIRTEDGPTDDGMQAFKIADEALMEIEAIADRILSAGSKDAYELRTLGMRLREVSTVIGFAIDNRNEGQVSWASLKARLTGIPEGEARHG